MLMNRVEYTLMNNPLRACIQRRLETRRLLAMGGRLDGGTALEVGCGRGIGIGIILDVFGADHVDAFDLDPRMVTLARRRTKHRGDAVELWVGDVTDIPSDNERYDAVFDFGIIHHVPNWRDALSEIQRVLKPGGRFYAEEVFRKFLDSFPWRQLLRHPRNDRFDRQGFCDALMAVGFVVVASKELHGDFGWFIADKKHASF